MNTIIVLFQCLEINLNEVNELAAMDHFLSYFPYADVVIFIVFLAMVK